MRDLAQRAVSHTRIKETCGEFIKQNPKEILKEFWSTLSVHGDPDLQKICGHFSDLQTERHAADYDLSATFTRSEALDACAKAKEAMDAWNHLKRQKGDLARLLALSILLWPGLAGRG